MEHRCLNCKFLEVNMTSGICYCSAGGLARRIEFYNPDFIENWCPIDRALRSDLAIKPKYELYDFVFLVRNEEIIWCQVYREDSKKALYWEWNGKEIIYYLAKMSNQGMRTNVHFPHCPESTIFETEAKAKRYLQCIKKN
ncbi:MAG: hypothetical protein J6J36_07005 [Clostridia bacterium]|nr:hypothetical protein [Clostridia bacterium]